MKRILLLVLCSMVLAGCSTYYNPATGRKETVWTSLEQERAIGQNAVTQYIKGKRVVEDRRASDAANRIATAIDSPRTAKKLIVYEDSDVQAFNTGGGYVAVTTALIANATDDELAAVIAHEMGHDEARHVIKHIEAQMGLEALINIAYMFDNREAYEKSEDWKKATEAANIAYVLVNNGFSRADEYEADRLSIRYMREAGYDPNAIISFLEKLQNLGQDKQWVYFLRSHPYLSERIAAARQEISALG